MTESKAPDPWVTGTPPVAQRVPGIHETPDTTYVDSPGSGIRRPVLIGLGVGLAVTAIVAAVVLGSESTDEAQKTRTIPAATKTAPSHSSTTTTTTTTEPNTVTAPAVVPSTAVTAPPATAARTSPPAPAVAPTPRATASPAAPVYTPVGLPAGVGGTISGCSWQAAGGGQYQASGTITNAPTTSHGWTITIHWLQNGREVGAQSALVDLGAGQSKPWSLSMGAPTAPADPFSCALSVE